MMLRGCAQAAERLRGYGRFAVNSETNLSA